jgi:putative transposase
MPRKGRSNEEIIHALHQWKKQFAGLGLSELRELRSLRHENSRLKQVVADLTLDRHILQEIVRKRL